MGDESELGNNFLTLQEEAINQLGGGWMELEALGASGLLPDPSLALAVPHQARHSQDVTWRLEAPLTTVK